MIPSPQSFQLFRDPLSHPGRFFFINFSGNELVAFDFDLKPDAFPNAFRKRFARDDDLPVLFAN